MGGISTENPVAAFERNAFLALSLPADATSKEVYRQQRRIENALELGDRETSSGFSFIPREPLSQEVVGDAVHRIEHQRAVEELFWVHQLSGKFTFDADSVESVIADLRASVSPNTTKGAVAQHNLAVIQMRLAQQSNEPRQLGYWRDGISNWNATLSNNLFWQFLEDRDELSSGFLRPEDLRAIVRETIEAALQAKLSNVLRMHNYSTIASLIDILKQHGQEFDSQKIQNAAGGEVESGFLQSTRRILDEVLNLDKDSDKNMIASTLASAEKQLNEAGAIFDQAVGHLGAKNTSSTIYDEWSRSLRQISIAYFNVLSNEREALRIAKLAFSLTRNSQLKADIEVDLKFLQRSQHMSEALVLLEAKNYTRAQEHLSKALALSTGEQVAEVQEMQAAVHRASIFGNVDSSQKSPGLRTVNGIGCTFYGNRDFDIATQSYVAIHWFVVFLLPIIPLASYRVRKAGNNRYQIYGKVPLSGGLRKYRWGVLAVIGILFLTTVITANSGTSGSSSPYTPTDTSSQAQASSAPSETTSSGDETESASGADSQSPQTQSAAPVSGSTFSAGSQTSSMSSLPSGDQSLEKEGIDQERVTLSRLADSLDEQKRDLESKSDELDKLKSYMNSVQATYTGGPVPEDVRQQYNATLEDYNRKTHEYNAAVRLYNSDLSDYKERVAAFNQRVGRYNANQ